MERLNMNNESDEASTFVENQHLNAALGQMSEAELKRLLNSIEALQIELSGLIGLLNGVEPIEAVTVTQRLLNILSDKINRIFAVKSTTEDPGRLQNGDDAGGWVDYAPVYHLLRMVSDGQHCLTWTDIGHVRR
jgi:hypothetical protein